MAYQNVGTPRFYCNIIEWGNVISGAALPEPSYSTHGQHQVFRTLPVDVKVIEQSEFSWGSLGTPVLHEQSFVAILGHNMKTAWDGDDDGKFVIWEIPDSHERDLTNVINTDVAADGIGVKTAYDGFSIATFNGVGMYSVTYKTYGSNYSAGSIIIGNYYDMPHSPDLNLTMTREMDGVKRIRTKGGADLVKHQYTKPPMWGDAAAWELHVDISTVTWSGVCENQASGDFGYETFNSVSETGFHAVHSNSYSRAGTNGTMNIVSGETYTVTFNLSLDHTTYTSGIPPLVDLKKHVVNGLSLTGNAVTRANNGFNELTFIATETSDSGLIGFKHMDLDEASEFDISNIYIQRTTGTTSNQELSRSGRRVWDLSFSYLQDSDVFPEISNINHFESGYDSYNDAQGKTLLDSNNFFSQVIHKTNGLPFIFQPDKNNSNSDGFAICKFDMKEFKFEQVANGVYNIKLKIREVW